METFTFEELKKIENIQAVQAALERLRQVGENPLIVVRLQRVLAELLKGNEELITRYNTAQGGQPEKEKA